MDDDLGVIWGLLTFHFCFCLVLWSWHEAPGLASLYWTPRQIHCASLGSGSSSALFLCLYLIMLTGFTLVQVRALSPFFSLCFFPVCADSVEMLSPFHSHPQLPPCNLHSHRSWKLLLPLRSSLRCLVLFTFSVAYLLEGPFLCFQFFQGLLLVWLETSHAYVWRFPAAKNCSHLIIPARSYDSRFFLCLFYFFSCIKKKTRGQYS